MWMRRPGLNSREPGRRYFTHLPDLPHRHREVLDVRPAGVLVLFLKSPSTPNEPPPVAEGVTPYPLETVENPTISSRPVVILQ